MGRVEWHLLRSKHLLTSTWTMVENNLHLGSEVRATKALVATIIHEAVLLVKWGTISVVDRSGKGDGGELTNSYVCPGKVGV